MAWSTKPYRNAVELQEMLMNDARNPETKAAVRGSLARSYCELEECKRKLKMKPLPKSVDVSKLPRNQRKRDAGPSFTEQPDSPNEPKE